MSNRAGAKFTVTDPRAPRRVADAEVKAVAGALQGDIAARTPRGDSGDLASGWQVTKDRDGKYRVSNPVPYARFVEYGTRHLRARPVMGQTLAAYRARSGRGRSR